MNYLDASIIIAATDPSSPLAPRIAAALGTMPKGDGCLSDLVRLECLVQPIRHNDSVRIARIETFFAGMTELPLDRAVYELATRLRANRRGLKTPDALHLATALRHGCAEFWTNDLDLAKVPAGLTFRTF